MAQRNQPYLPLYVQDVLTDEKLIECSAAAHGVYFRLLCVLHKQEEYGVLCLKQKYKQNESKYLNFASMLAKQMPFEVEIITDALEELCREGVVQIEDDLLSQKRMVRDGNLSDIRASAGRTGGKKTQSTPHIDVFAKAKVQASAKAKQQANADIDIENDIEDVIDIKHKYGMYLNVLLTDEDLVKLKAEFPDWSDRIDNLSEGIETKGYKYKSHLATIRAWARKDKENGSKRNSSGNAGNGDGTGAGRTDDSGDGDDYSNLQTIRC